MAQGNPAFAAGYCQIVRPKFKAHSRVNSLGYLSNYIFFKLLAVSKNLITSLSTRFSYLLRSTAETASREPQHILILSADIAALPGKLLPKRHSRQDKPQRMSDVEPAASNKRLKTRSQEESSITPIRNSNLQAPAGSAAPGAETRTLWVMEIGASHFQLMHKKPGREWDSVRWPRRGHTRELPKVIPTMATVERDPVNGNLMTFCGREAFDEAYSRPRLDTFRYLKLAFINDEDDRAPDLIRHALRDQERRARSYNANATEIANTFFQEVLKKVHVADGETAVLYFNIVDIWPNAVGQDLLNHFQKILPGVEIHAVDECLSSVFGIRHSETSGGTSKGCALITVDCGDSTTNICRLRPSKKKKDHYQIEHYVPLMYGAGSINAAVEGKIRKINRAHSRSPEANVVKMSYFVDMMKPNMERQVDSDFGFNEDDWDMIITAAKNANRELDERRIKQIESMLKDNKAEAPNERVKVILTGGASASPTFNNLLTVMMSREYPNAEILPTGSEYVLWFQCMQATVCLANFDSTAVLAGLQHIAEHPEILHVTHAPLSLWMRSDCDGQLDTRATRVCRKGQKLCPKSKRGKQRLDRDPSKPMRFELENYGDGPVILDLSVFGTPRGKTDEEIFTPDSPDTEPDCTECFVYAQIGDLESFGSIEKEVPLTDLPADGKCHVYVFSQLNAVEVKLYAVFAANGREMKQMEIQKLASVEYYRTHVAPDIEFLQLGQVARPKGIVGREI